MKKLFLLIMAMMLASQSAFAGLKISPIQLFISEKTKKRSVTLTLDAKAVPAAKIFEMSAVKWTQNANGEDILEPDPSVIINPKNFVIQPDGKQIIRVGFSQALGAMNLNQEGTWRIIFSEVPAITQETAVNFLFNISVPLFVGKQDKVNLVVEPVIENKRLLMQVKNNADSHIQILKITLLDQNKKQVISSSEMKYLLAQQQYQFDLGETRLGDIKNYQLLVETDKSDQPLEIKMKS